MNEITFLNADIITTQIKAPDLSKVQLNNMSGIRLAEENQGCIILERDFLAQLMTNIVSNKLKPITSSLDACNQSSEIPIWDKYCLTITESAKYYGIGENKLRRLAEENPRANWLIQNGQRLLIKRIKFEQVIDSLDTI